MMSINCTPPCELTDVFVRSFRNDSGRRVEIRDTKVTGLVLRVTSKNKKTFTLHTRMSTHDKIQITVGSYPTISLKEARAIARSHLADIQRGHDPRQRTQLLKVRSAAQGITLAALLDEVEPVFGLTRSIWREGNRFGRTKPEARAAIENVFSRLLEKPLGRLSLADFSKAVRTYKPKRPRNGKKTANGTTARALSYLRPVLDWASHRGRFAKENAGRIQKLELPDLSNIQDPSIDDPTLEVKRTRVLTQDELAQVMPYLAYPAPEGLRSNLDPRADYGPVAFRFLLLTLSRREEVSDARRKDFDLRAGTWTKKVKTRRKPGSRGTAERRTVTIPLSGAAMELLLSLPSFIEGKPDDLVFISSDGGRLCNWDRTQKAINRASKTSGWHRHDLRRTGATILGQLGVAPAIIDTLLSHLNPFNRSEVSTAATNYIIDTKILKEAVDQHRLAVNLLADALRSISIAGANTCDARQASKPRASGSGMGISTDLCGATHNGRGEDIDPRSVRRSRTSPWATGH